MARRPVFQRLITTDVDGRAPVGLTPYFGLLSPWGIFIRIKGFTDGELPNFISPLGEIFLSQILIHKVCQEAKTLATLMPIGDHAQRDCMGVSALMIRNQGASGNLRQYFSWSLLSIGMDAVGLMKRF